VGLGGGVIIRPILDAIGHHNVLNIAFLSSSAVIVMAIVSTMKKVKDGTKIDVSIAAFISVGAMIGGVIGNMILEYLVYTFDAEANAQIIQTIATIITLILAIYFTNRNDLRYKLKAKAFYPVIGIGLGALAVFLGIGGGPINVPIFMILFSLPVKYATAYSIVIIFFAHSARMVTMGFTEGFLYFDLQYLLFIIPAAIIGGMIGAIISRKISDEAVKKSFLVTMVALIIMNVYNGITFVL
jgi:hypothetical protein